MFHNSCQLNSRTPRVCVHTRSYAGVGGDLNLESMTSLTSVQLPALTTVGGGVLHLCFFSFFLLHSRSSTRGGFLTVDP